jgi:MFS transporter, FHS family, glucose/mannose:H+ symporter
MMIRSTRAVFASACLGMLLFGISLITLGAVAPGLQDKFHLDAVASGTLFSILPFGIIGGSFVFGPIADRYGYRIIFLIACLCMFAGFQGIAYSSSLALLKVCVFVFGVGGGAINGASNALVSDISQENKTANLSLLGVFFAIGALGMPVILGVLEKDFSFEVIVSSVGYVALAAAILFILTVLPPPKQTQGVPFSGITSLLSHKLLLLVGFFLFCQSSFEGVINNWSTTFLPERMNIPVKQALYAVSLYVTGMAVARLLLGSVLRKIPVRSILIGSCLLLFTGSVLLLFANSYLAAVAGMICLGAGLAAGFPVMLGFVGERYAAVSGTAFSVVITMALTGNMIVNYLMGLVAENFGIRHLTSVIFLLGALMLALSLIITARFKPLKP